MKKRKYLVNALEIGGLEFNIINKIVESDDCDKALDIAVKVIEEEFPDRVFKYICVKLSDIERISKKDLTIREIMKTTYSEKNLRSTIKMFEEMLIKGLSLNTLGNLFSPYLMIYDHNLQEFSLGKKFDPNQLSNKVTYKIVEIGFRYLPKKVKPFGLEIQNYELHGQRKGHLKNNNFSLFVKHQEDKSKQWNFVDFVIELCVNIPDVPVRIETIVIEHL